MSRIGKLMFIFMLCGTLGAKPVAKPRAAVSRRVATQKFSGLKLKGQLKKPDLSYIYKRKGLRADQVVDVPEDFNRDIIDSALSF